MRNRARNRKEQEKEAERQAAYYADGGPFDNLFAGTIDGHNPDCDVFDRPPEGIVKPCNCGPVTDLHGKPLFTDKSDCFVHSPETAIHNQALDSAIEFIDVVDGDLYIKTDIVRSRQLTTAELSPELLAHRKRTPLCWLDPCNDPACRLDHLGRESK